MKEKNESKEPASKEQEIPLEKCPMSNLENYIHPIDIDHLQSIQEIIELVLKNYEKKLEPTKNTNLILKFKNIVIKLPELA